MAPLKKGDLKEAVLIAAACTLAAKLIEVAIYELQVAMDSARKRAAKARKKKSNR